MNYIKYNKCVRLSHNCVRFFYTFFTIRYLEYLTIQPLLFYFFLKYDGNIYCFIDNLSIKYFLSEYWKIWETAVQIAVKEGYPLNKLKFI